MQYLSSAVFQIISIVMSILMATGAIVAPSTDQPIEPANDPNLTFVAIADSQVSNYLFSREKVFISAADDIKNAKGLDALVIVGDIAENGCQSEFDRVALDLDGATVANYVMVSGNHDIRLREYAQSSERFLTFMNNLNGNDESKVQTSLYYSTEINGYHFIVLGSEKMRMEDAYISSEQLGWLNNQLAEASKDVKPIFVLCQYPLTTTHGLPLTWGHGNNYDNVFFITGHLHTGFGQYTYEKLGKVEGINLPSVGIENKDGEYNDSGTGYYVEVYDSSVIFRARDFSKGTYLPQFDIEFNF